MKYNQTRYSCFDLNNPLTREAYIFVHFNSIYYFITLCPGFISRIRTHCRTLFLISLPFDGRCNKTYTLFEFHSVKLQANWTSVYFNKGQNARHKRLQQENTQRLTRNAQQRGLSFIKKMPSRAKYICAHFSLFLFSLFLFLSPYEMASSKNATQNCILQRFSRYGYNRGDTRVSTYRNLVRKHSLRKNCLPPFAPVTCVLQRGRETHP